MCQRVINCPQGGFVFNTIRRENGWLLVDLTLARPLILCVILLVAREELVFDSFSVAVSV
jgi:hypothetical protein